MWFMLILSILVICLLYYYVCVKPYKYWKNKHVPFPKAYPIVGNFLDFVLKKKHVLDVFDDLYNEFPDERYLGIYQLSTASLLVRDLNLIKQITVKDFDHFPDHLHVFSPDSDPVLGQTLISLRGSEWKSMRSTLSPAFTSAKIKNMFILMVDCAKDFVNYFEKQTEPGMVVEEEGKNIFSKYTNDVIASTAFGIKCDSLKDPKNEFFRHGRALTTFTFWQSIKIFIFQFVPKLSQRIPGLELFPTESISFFRKIMRETIKEREEKHIIRPDLIHLLMKARKGQLTHESPHEDKGAGFATVQESNIGESKENQVKELTEDMMTAQALIFFLAGFDTVSNVSCYMSYELAVNPDIQKKLQDEIHEVMGQSSDGIVTYDALLKMKYLDQVVSESMRKWPPAFLTDRQCEKDYIIKPELPHEKEVLIEKGKNVMIPIMAIHRDAKYFPNPEKFDPDRFSDENKSSIIPGSYLPFGVGPRNCIGSRFALLEIKVLFFYLLFKFDIIPVAKTEIPLKINPKSLIAGPKNGFWIGFKPRK